MIPPLFLPLFLTLQGVRTEENQISQTMSLLLPVYEANFALDIAISDLQETKQELEQAIRKTCRYTPPGCGLKSVVGGALYTTPAWFPIEHVLIDGCDDHTGPLPTEQNHEQVVDWWVGPNQAQYPDSFFVVDLGCQRCVSQALVRNSANGRWNDRSTEDFLISVATEQKPDVWVPVTRGHLLDPRNVTCQDQEGIRTFPFRPTLARFARFEVLSYYGHSATLQYFDLK